MDKMGFRLGCGENRYDRIVSKGKKRRLLRISFEEDMLAKSDRRICWFV